MELSVYSADHERSPDWIDDLLEGNTIFAEEVLITESEEEDRAAHSKSVNNTDDENTKLICVVCGDVAHGHNFDQLTCESCKAFFRRNALKDLSHLKCRYSGSCIINPVTRRLCSYCRLKKCFDMKMRKEWIRTDQEKQLRALFKKIKNGRNAEQEATLMSIKEFNLVQRRKKRIHPPSTYLMKTFQTFSVHRDLLDTDQISLNNLCNAYAKGKDLVDFSHITNPKPYTCMADFLNYESRTYQSFIHFLKNIRDFHDLDLSDQILLVKRNASTLIFLHHVLASGFYQHPFLEEFGTKMMGYDFQNRITKARAEFDCFMKQPQIMILAMVLFSFASNLSIPRFVNDEIYFKDPKKIVCIQDFYLELLWKYLAFIFKDEDKARRSIQLIVTQILRFQTVNAMLEDHLCASGHPPTMHPLMESVYRFT